MTVLHGQSRTVLLVGPFALKLPCVLAWRRFLWGLLSNLSERERAGTEGACPILWAAPLGTVLLMPRCDPVPPDHPIPDDVRRLAGYDDKPDSYGLHRGRVVALDFHGGV